MKQVEPTGGTVSPSAVVPLGREGSQLVVEVGPIVGVAKASPSVSSSIFVNRK